MENKKITFKEYYESKKILLTAINQLPKIVIEYVVKKYCKIPLLINETKDSGKLYLTLKPKDSLKIIWESHGDEKIIKQIILHNIKYYPAWSVDKMKSWLESTVINNRDM